MASNGQKYRYGGLVVEVCRIKELDRGSRYKCLVRGYGHNNPAPRETYNIDTETSAMASREALQMYNLKYGQKKH